MCAQVPDDGRRSLEACPTVPVSLVVPVYNEAETVGLFLDRVGRVVDGESAVRLEVVFVNDGSSDATLERLLEYQQQDTRVRVVDLSRNFGKEAALTAGMRIAKGRLVVPIDVDLQAPPELIFEMIEQWRQGYDVVLARRVGRDTDSRAKRISTAWFYRIYNRIAEPMIPEDVSDFRLMDRTVVDALNGLPESGRFMKGLFAWVGFRTTCVDYACPERAARLQQVQRPAAVEFCAGGPYELQHGSVADLDLSRRHGGAGVVPVCFLYRPEGPDLRRRHPRLCRAAHCRYLPRRSPAHGNRHHRRVSGEDLS